MVPLKQTDLSQKLLKLRREGEEREAERLAQELKLSPIDLSKTPVSSDALKLLSEEEAKKSYEKLTEINKISDIPLSYKIMTKDSDIMGFIMPAILKKDQDGNAVVLDFGGLFRQKYRGSTALMASSIIEKQCFNVRTIDKLVASALSDNYNPQAIFLRLGFEYAGQTKKSDDGKAINVFELTRKKFSFPDFKPARIKGIKEYIDKMPEMLPSSSDFIKPFCLEA